MVLNKTSQYSHTPPLWRLLGRILNHLIPFFFILYFQLDTLLFCLRTMTVVFFPLHAAVPNGRTTKTSAEGENTIGCWYNLDLLMMGL